MNTPKILAMLLIATSTVEQYIHAQDADLPITKAWIINTANEIHHIELPSGKVIASIGTPQVFITDIALDSTGQLYGISGNQLYKIDKKSARAILISGLDADERITSIEFRSDDVLIGTAEGRVLYRIDLNTGKTIKVFTAPRSVGSGFLSIAINEKDDIYAIVAFGGLYKISADFQSWKFNTLWKPARSGLTYANNDMLYAFAGLFNDYLCVIDPSKPEEKMIRYVGEDIYTSHNWVVRDTTTNPRFYKPAKLGVLNPTVVLPSIPGEPAQFGFEIQTKSHKIYVIESTENLTASAWSPVQWIAGDGKLKNFLQSIKEQVMQIFRVQEIPQGFLSFPLEKKTPYTAEISAVFDHSEPTGCSNGIMVAYTGEKGLAEYGHSIWSNPGESSSCLYDILYGFPKAPLAEEKPFIINQHYTGGGLGSKDGKDAPYLLFYDGHTGYDYPVANGTPVYAASAGSVKHIVTDSVFSYLFEIALQHTNDLKVYETYYLHLSSTSVKKGEIIKDQQEIGKTGYNHLHFTVKKNGTRVDPYGWYGKNGEDPSKVDGHDNVHLWNLKP